MLGGSGEEFSSFSDSCPDGSDFFPRKFTISTEETANSSELSFDSSEVLYHPSEEISNLHGAIEK